VGIEGDVVIGFVVLVEVVMLGAGSSSMVAEDEEGLGIG
jgi:hypothetical protein